MTLKTESEADPFNIEELFCHPDDLLPPVLKLEKYATSEMVFNRQVVARNLLETLRMVQGNQDDVARVIHVLCSISEDFDSSVRTDLVVQLPHIAAFCKEADLENAIPEFLVPIIINYLGDELNQVRKSSHSVLLSLIELKLIDTDTIKKRICPFVVHLTESIHSEELRVECILLMSKLATLLGKELTEEVFLEHFFFLCGDKTNNIRKACASAFGDFCTVAGREVTEEVLLPRFFVLCEDAAWCVRKACTENFMPVSCVVSRETRWKELASQYMVLLSDQSRWVRLTAYQTLGPFISTFAEPEKTGLYYSKDGVLTVVDFTPSPVQNSLSQELSDEVKNMKCKVSTDSSETSKCNVNHSSLDRTISSKSCDSLVPLNNVDASLTASEVPGITCHVGSNYRTVIEVSSPNLTSPAASNNQETENVVKNFPSENGIHSDKEGFTENSDSECINYSSNIPSVDYCSNIFKLQNSNFLMSEKDSSLSEIAPCNSDNVSSLENGDCCKEMNGDNDISGKFEDTKIVENSKVDLETKLLNSITVNGINVSSSIALVGATKYEIKPLVTCSASTDDCETDLSKSHLSTKLQVTENKLQVDLLKHSTGSKLSEIQDLPCKISSFESLAGATLELNHTPSNVQSSEDSVELNSTNDGSFHDESAFNYFQFWRIPLPDVDVDVESVDPSDSCNSTKLCNSGSDFKYFVRNSTDPFVQTVNVVTEKLNCRSSIWSKTDDITSENKEGEPPPGSKQISVHEQDIVPPELLSRYLSMIDATWAQTIDAEIARHCAYSLPAVALTLGREYWPCLKETFDALSSDLQGFIMMWKVRRTVASSMHQLAVILGPDLTSSDLLPVFSRFICDLDEVRIGILQHMSEFLKVLRLEERRGFLPSFRQFLISNSDTDNNDKNWRFRLILAEQLVSIADLYEPQDVREYLVPLTLTLIRDKICEVRLAAVLVMAAVMRRMSQSPTSDLTKNVLSELTDKFIHAPKWLHRQLYVYICQAFITEKSLPPDQFAEDALPHLLYLCWDRIPNVRIAIARCLSVVIWPLETFSSPESPHRELLLQTIHTLQSDLDADVRYYANMVSTHECSCLQHGEFSNLGELPV
ncbi:serine/threonine-protein phosphatase 4 regulatory subunit 1-like isoform X2 [Uloborus diversus]|nr:serine/threonine-protein phosphatase 4 regulatory subunit 1-like isoform X2 [Uloborus diversus]